MLSTSKTGTVLLFLVSTLLTGCGGNNEQPQGSRTVGPIEFDTAFTASITRDQVIGNWLLTSFHVPPQNSYPYTVEFYCPGSIREDAYCGDGDTIEFRSDGTLSYRLESVTGNRRETTSGTGTWSYVNDKLTFTPGFGKKSTFIARLNPTDNRIQFVSTDGSVGRTFTRL